MCSAAGISDRFCRNNTRFYRAHNRNTLGDFGTFDEHRARDQHRIDDERGTSSKRGVVGDDASRCRAHRGPVTDPAPAPSPAPAQPAPTAPAPLAVPPPAAPPPAADPAPSCGPDSYINSDGVCVHRPAQAPGPPSGATAKCRDGTYSFSQHRSGTCSGHGGVAAWL
ncbi:DUF3761 domain-containing protein [Nocardia sp. NPDC052566]|uniref:DUF3761 domain-containing protein n=1 Tax=Nocardia sp. NPDC052566 TaxID=3364330 RepID=UPI0037CB8465